MRKHCILLFIAVLLLAPLTDAVSSEKGLTVKNVRFFSYAAFTRIVFEIDAAAPYVMMKSDNGRSVTLSAYNGPLAVTAAMPAVRDGVVKAVELRQESSRMTIVVQLDAAAGEVKDFVLRGPDRIVLDVMKGAAAAAPATKVERRKLIVLDPGHGGVKDAGMVTAQGQEKTVTLEIADAIRQRLLKKNAELAVTLTRERDQTLSLDDRAGAANAAGAVLFVSIHASTGAGTRVYIVDPDEGSLADAPAANKTFLDFDTGNEQQERIWGSQQASHIKASGDLGRRLALQLGMPGGEPVQAPLAGLKAVDAAAVIVEVGIGQDRSWVADMVAEGIAAYVRENR
jgi:N-acetylmuramoyl-L-alanine amidase